MRISLASRLACSLALAPTLAIAVFAAAAQEYGVEIVEHQTPARLEEAAVLEIPLRLRNSGSATWDPDRSFRVAYHWFSDSGDPLLWDGERTPLPHRVGPGEEVRLSARVTVPLGTGPRLLQWDVVHEGVTWISQVATEPPPRIPVEILPGEFSHAFSVLSHRTPRLMWAGSVRKVTTVIRNDGTEVWSPERPIHLSYHWQHDEPERAMFGGARTTIPERTARTDAVEIEAEIVAPDAAGLYRLQWDMVEENVTWFSQRDPTPEEPMMVLVLPVLGGPPVAMLVVLLGLGLATAAVTRPSLPVWLRSLAAVTDLVCLAAALSLKQSVVFAEMELPPAPGSGWVVASGVAAVVIAVAMLPRRIRPWCAVGINAGASALILADVIHLRFFGDVTSAATAGAAGQIGNVLESIRSLLAPRDWWLVMDLIPAVAVAILVAKLLPETGPAPARRFALFAFPFLIPGLAALWTIANQQAGKYVQTFQNALIVREIGLLNYHAHDLWKQFRIRIARDELSEERRQEIEAWFRETVPRRAGTGPWFGAARGKNLIMLQVESMQAFVIGLRIEGQEITPNLNRWQNCDALSFVCSDQTAQGRTSDGEFATQVSLLPLPEGAVAFRFGRNDYDALADRLAGAGYRTLSAVPFEGAFWNRIVTHPEYGYRINLFRDGFAPGPVVGWGLNDRDFLRQMVPRLEALRQPFAALLITLSNHHPYASFPDDLKELDLGRWEGTAIGNYLHAMHLFDIGFGELLESLEQKGLLSNTVIALWGDHSSGLSWDRKLGELIGRPATEPEY
ncbi:MAG TPA: LTA synthase family protein, partial [Thermoanaerobaculia bacterium]|nr:LTA synthase family protein [Thermoanaerobaculia bacterium]